MRPHLDYGDIIYDQLNNESFTQKIERIQYNPTHAITGAIKATSQNTLYIELGFESLKFRLWFRKLCIFLPEKSRRIVPIIAIMKTLLSQKSFYNCSEKIILP